MGYNLLPCDRNLKHTLKTLEDKANKVNERGIDITDAMRQSVLIDGQALFQKQGPHPLRPGEDRETNQQFSLFAIRDFDKAGQAVSTTPGTIPINAL